MQQVLPRATFRHRYGIRPALGDAASYVQQGAAVATPVVTGVLASGASASAAAGGTGLILGMAPALAIPVVGAAIAGIAIAVTMLLRSGCGKSCVITSNWANEAEALLLKNIQQYFAIPTGQRTKLHQAAALENFDKVWNYLASECATVPGRAGEDCVKDRKAGACEWKQTSDSILLQYPGQPQPGQCWNWFSGYRDPIANDTQVVETPAQTLEQAAAAATQGDMGVAQQLLTAAGNTLSQVAQSEPLLSSAGALLIAIALMGKKD